MTVTAEKTLLKWKGELILNQFLCSYSISFDFSNERYLKIGFSTHKKTNHWVLLNWQLQKPCLYGQLLLQLGTKRFREHLTFKLLLLKCWMVVSIIIWDGITPCWMDRASLSYSLINDLPKLLTQNLVLHRHIMCNISSQVGKICCLQMYPQVSGTYYSPHTCQPP